MLSILVCHSYFLHLDPKQAARGKPYPPLATLQAAALLRTAGHDVALFDAMLAHGMHEYDDQLRDTAPQLVVIYEDTFNFLSKMCLASMRRAACDMVAAAVRAGARVIVAGPDVTDAPGPYLKAGADLALIGEGLVTLADLLPRLDAGLQASAPQLAHGLSGVALLREGEVTVHSGARLMPASRYDGRAAWDLAQIDRYRAVWLQSQGYFSLNLSGSRGCSFRCAWCAKPTWGNHYLQRSARDVASELVYLKHEFRCDHIWFADDIFGFRHDWVREFADTLSELGGGLPFTIQTRADLVSERMTQALKDAGCAEAWIGAESGSQSILDAMNKGTTVPEILSARRRLGNANIRVGFFIQLGYLGERLPDILATRDLLASARPDEIGVSVSYPLPGTTFYDRVKAQLGSKTRWQDSSDLAMMFHGTYDSEFYRAVRNLLHEQIAAQNAAHGASADEAALSARWCELIDREAAHRHGTHAGTPRANTLEARHG